MAISSHGFVEWKEEFISQERGSRVVHYFLKNSDGDSVLAVVGTERSLRHMVYVVSDDFLQFCGSEMSNHACFKWRSRREVVDWLTSLLSKQQQSSSQDHSKLSAHESVKSLGAELSAIGVELGGYVNRRKDHFARNLKDHNWDIVWSGAAWSCGKQLKHFPAFCRNGTTVAIHSFVLVMAKEENHYLAYLEDMYEDKKGQKKVKVRWFHQSQEVVSSCRIPPPTPHPREVFITPHAQVISAECVDGFATVLTPEHFEKCLSFLPDTSPSSDRTYLCFRQFRNNRIKPFNLSKLRGYFDQSILSCIDLHVVSKNKLEEEEFSNEGSVKRGTKRSRSCRGRQSFTTAHSDVGISERGSKIMASGPDYRMLRFGLPGRRPLAKYLRPQCRFSLSYNIGDKVELLCQDSGIRGCWFRCTVLQISQKRLKVQYENVQNEDGCGNLEEWIPASRTAAPDKLDMRCSGRPTVRPSPAYEQLADDVYEIGIPVDAWWSDGWWEGVVTDVGCGGNDHLQVYFPGEDVFLISQRRNLRISRDWNGSQWVDIGVKPDILLTISAISPGIKISVCKVAESGGSAIAECEAPVNSGQDLLEAKQALAGLATISGLLENSKWVKEQQWNEDEVARDDGKDHDDGVDGDSINNAQDGNDDGDQVDGKLVMEVDLGSAGQTCEMVAA
ncbi:hypothetical protein AAC387_Pa09g2428 [Persea americana]